MRPVRVLAAVLAALTVPALAASCRVRPVDAPPPTVAVPPEPGPAPAATPTPALPPAPAAEASASPDGTSRPVAGADACKTDADCVAEQCCHPTSCVARANAPSCAGTMCTRECRGGTMDCGGGCLCQAGRCAARLGSP